MAAMVLMKASDLADLPDEPEPIADTDHAWAGEIETKVSFVDGVDRDTGKPIKIRVTHQKIVLTREGHTPIVFGVSRRYGKTAISDTREMYTGARDPNWGRLAGPTRGETHAKAGKRKSLTPSEWAREVERLIGWPAAIKLLAAVGAPLQ